jgi:hypothetical protein
MRIAEGSRAGMLCSTLTVPAAVNLAPSPLVTAAPLTSGIAIDSADQNGLIPTT